MIDLNKYFKQHLQGRSILNEYCIELDLFAEVVCDYLKSHGINAYVEYNLD